MECRSKLVALMEFVYKPQTKFTVLLLQWGANAMLFSLYIQSCFQLPLNALQITCQIEISYLGIVFCGESIVCLYESIKRIYTDAGEDGCEGRDLETRGEV